MDFTAILECLQDPVKRNEYIARLKSAGQNSQPVLDLKNSMEALKMHQSPKHSSETTMLQHTFKFCDALECFLQFRLVCKSWKHAVETIRFDQDNTNHPKGYKTIDNKNYLHPLKTYLTHPNFLSKFLNVFKKLRIMDYSLPENVQWNIFGPLIVNNTKKLKKVLFYKTLTENTKTYFHQILQKSKTTLTTINCYDFPYPNILFPNLTWIRLSLYNEAFKASFPQLLKNHPNLEVVNIHLPENAHVSLLKHIGEYYPNHCISLAIGTDCDSKPILQYLPIKILTCIENLDFLDQKKYNDELEYISFMVELHKATELGWDRHQEIFDQCNKLKQIAFTLWKEDEDDDVTLSDLEGDEFNFWNERMDYFKKRGIEIVERDQIIKGSTNNEELQAKVAKEIGVKWRFDFW